MPMTDHVELRSGVYHDSVTLMRVSQAVLDAPGVTAAQVGMATPLNVELTVGLGFSVPDSGPQDLLVALRADDEAGVASGLAALDAALLAADRRPAAGSGATAPARTVRAAAADHPDAAVVLLSIPGNWVLGEAMDAIAAGRSVMIFSDNVPVADEIALKDAAGQAGVLVMGPDCGTAIVSGVGLGFANVLRGNGSGPTVGVVAASGTGAQQLTVLLDEAGVPVSHVLGVGGRDLSAAVGARSAVQALRMLDADPATEQVLVISKPPAASAAATLAEAADAATTPVHTVLLGTGDADITSTVEDLLTELDLPVPDWPVWGAPPAPAAGALRGLFSGGTLADEAMLVASPILGSIRSNIPLSPDDALPADAIRHGLPQLTGLGSAVVDLGDDAFTVGRSHPMIDPSLRLDLLAQQAADPQVSVLLLDVVLGFGAEPDPAARLAPALRSVIDGAGRPLRVVISLCGTAADPQQRDRQAATLVDAGATVYLSNAAAARAAAHAAAGEEA
jgi:FdrA protein